MADATTNITPDSFGRWNSNGYIADAAAIGSILNAKDLADQINDIEESTEDGFSRMLEQFGLVGVQNEKLASAQGVQAEKLAAAIGLQAEKNASAAVLLATQLAAAQAAKACECCCEIKERIAADGAETRELIVSIEQRNSDRRETDLKIDLSNCKQSAHFAHLLDEKFEHFHRRCGPGPT